MSTYGTSWFCPTTSEPPGNVGSRLGRMRSGAERIPGACRPNGRRPSRGPGLRARRWRRPGGPWAHRAVHQRPRFLHPRRPPTSPCFARPSRLLSTRPASPWPSSGIPRRSLAWRSATGRPTPSSTWRGTPACGRRLPAISGRCSTRRSWPPTRCSPCSAELSRATSSTSTVCPSVWAGPASLLSPSRRMPASALSASRSSRPHHPPRPGRLRD